MHIINPYRFSTGSTGTTLKTGLISCWELDETSGTTATDSHGSNAGTYVGSISNGETGILNYSYYFDNTEGKYIDINNTLISNFPLSISIWVKLSTTSNIGLFASNDYTAYAGFSVSMSGTNIVISFGNGGGTGPSNRKTYVYDTTNSTDVWYNIVATSTSIAQANNKVYKNGKLISYLNTSGTSSTVNWTLGETRFPKNWVASNAQMYGYVDQTAIWSKELSTTEISTLYGSGNGLSYENW